MYKTGNYNKLPSNPFSTNNTTSTTIESFQEAIVVDVVVNNLHKEYAGDGYNVGAIQFRYLKSNAFRDKQSLNWAFPLESNITEYPLLNEIVVITEYLNRYYYTKRINVSNRVTSQPLFGLNEELSPKQSASQKVKAYKQTTSSPIKENNVENKLGTYFKEKPEVYRLKHDEGDIVFEGRSGQSIRFGTAWKTGTNFQSLQSDQAPNILLKVGPSKLQKPTVNTPFGLTVENINDDATSVWLASDQVINLNFATKNNSIHGASFKDIPDSLRGNQVVVNTDTFVVNTKNNKIIGSSAKGIHWTTLENFTVDANSNYISKINGFSETTIGKRMSILSPKIYLGSKDDENEPVVCGTQLAKFLEDFIDAHLSNASKHGITSSGPAILNPSIVKALTKLKQDVATGKYSSFNSRVSYITK